MKGAGVGLIETGLKGTSTIRMVVMARYNHFDERTVCKGSHKSGVGVLKVTESIKP